MKCSLCGNVGEFLYIASRNVNERGEISDIVGDAELWISYYRCPECGNIDIDILPKGEKPEEVKGEK
jgi:hypothetical protein